jgi:outer membrane protein TolC
MPGHRLSARIHQLGTDPLAFHRLLRLVGALFFAAACGGCAAFSPDGGMTRVNGIVAPELKSEAVKVNAEDAAGEARARVARSLASTLSADGAVRIALLNNKGLQASYNELGVAEAAMVEASLPPSPTFSLSRIWTPVELDIERRIIADILALATLPARTELAAERFHQAQLRAALETLRIGFETRQAYYRAIAAQGLAASLAQAVSAAESAAKLAKELGETGAMNKLDQAREEAFYVELAAQLAIARQRPASERERLIRALGLQDGGALRLPQALPPLPNAPRTLIAVETEAIRRRIDLKIARVEVDTLAKTYGLTNATRSLPCTALEGKS